MTIFMMATQRFFGPLFEPSETEGVFEDGGA